jgi:hypothetical protein
MNRVFREYLDKFVIVFLDDILNYSETKKEHEKHLRMVLQVLREDKLYVMLSKCIFYQKKIHYFGHTISAEGIAVDLEKIKAIRGWSAPRNVKEFISFMGLTCYYRRFIKGFSNIASSITSLQKKGVKFEWTLKCEEIFQQLKDILTSAPILKITDPDKDFVVCNDACKEGFGGVINQKDHVVCYESRKLKERKRNYATRDLELATIVHVLKMCRHCLMGRRVELKKDHCGLKHLFGQPTLNVRQTKWLEFLSKYDFGIKHIKGKENQVTDALSRRAHEMHISIISVFSTNLKHRILGVANSDRQYVKIKETLQQHNLQRKFNYYELKKDGILMYKGKICVKFKRAEKYSIEGNA